MNSKHTFVVLAYKESRYLEKCIQSVLNQSYKSNVVIATSTPNKYISQLADKYNLKIITRANGLPGIGYDFEFARKCVDSCLVTIAHQDDIYEKSYSQLIVNEYEKNKDALIIFSNYYEIKNDVKIRESKNLRVKNFLLSSLKVNFLHINRFKFFKRNTIRFGNSICCPAVTFVNHNIKINDIFITPMKSNVDWYAWENLSRQKGAFVFVNKQLMGHRVHSESETSKTIEANKRTIEDLEMFDKFWPHSFSVILSKLYKNSEKGNSL